MRKIEIQGTEYPVKFGYGAFRILGEKWNCKGVQSVAQKFQEIFPEEGSEDVSFEQADKIGDLALAGIENAGCEEIPQRDEVVQEILFNGDKLQVILTAFSESFPKSGNPQPPQKGRKKKK